MSCRWNLKVTWKKSDFAFFNKMITLNFVMFTLALAKDICISHSLLQDGKNVCSKRRLEKVVDEYPTTWAEDWDCEASYPTPTCERIRSNEIDINSVYFVQEDLVCCPGWLLPENGDECSQSCPDGYFGENCMYECRCLYGRNPNQCNAEDGSCDCLAGWTGRECDQRCSPGFFGPNCGERSIFTCMNGGISHPDSGLCLCMSQYGGSRCEIQCGGTELFDCGLINCNNCVQNRTLSCDQITQVCLCRDGWKGRYCSDPCDIGTTGQFCAESCCSGRGFCTGEGCICADGYHGDECQHKCSDGTFGRSCREICECPSCNHVTGNCDVCPIGFTGGRCTERCLPSQWGQSCNLTCSCEESDMCDVFTGECYGSPNNILLLILVPVCVSIIIICSLGGFLFVCIRKRRAKHEPNKASGAVVTYLPDENRQTPQINTFNPAVGDYSYSRTIHAEPGPDYVNQPERNTADDRPKNSTVTDQTYTTTVSEYDDVSLDDYAYTEA